MSSAAWTTPMIATAVYRAGTTHDPVRRAPRKAAAGELLRAREDALSHMGRAGRLALDVPPQRAAAAAQVAARRSNRRS